MAVIVVAFIAAALMAWGVYALWRRQLYMLAIPLAFVALLAVIGGTQAITSPDSIKTQPVEKYAVVLRDNDEVGASTIRAGRQYSLLEGSTDKDWAQALIAARAAGNADGVETAYQQPQYQHFDREAAPHCLVETQAQVHMTEYNVGGRGFDAPIACDLDDGTKVYATNLGPLH